MDNSAGEVMESSTVNIIPTCPVSLGTNLSLDELNGLSEACRVYNNQTDDGIQLTINDYISIVAYIVIFIFCIVGNALVVITLMQHRRMRTVTNLFLINLSIGGEKKEDHFTELIKLVLVLLLFLFFIFVDLLLGVFCMPFTLSGQILKRFVFGAAMCHMILYFQGKMVS